MLPGVCAVQAVAARAGAPIGGDFAVMSLSDRLKPWALIAQRLRAVAEADLVLAIYNPASRSRTDAGRRRPADPARAPLAGDTVVVVGRDVGRAEESLTVTTLGELDPGDDRHEVPADRRRLRHAYHGSGQAWTPRFTE